MTEYITKEQALEAVKGKMWPGELEAAIKAVPAADVMPIVHAKWEFYDENIYGHNILLCSCSHCKNTVPAKAAKHFCTYCGAKMDGGNRNA